MCAAPTLPAWWCFLPSRATPLKSHSANNKEHLRIQSAADDRPLKGLPRVRVYSASLRAVENSKDSLLRVYVSVPVQKFKARQIGNGSIEIRGLQADEFDGDVAAGRGSCVSRARPVRQNSRM